VLVTLLGWRTRSSKRVQNTQFPFFTLQFNKQIVSGKTSEEIFIEYAIEKGETILKYQEQQNQINTEKYSFERKVFGGYTAICLNTTIFSSETVKTKYDPSKHDLMLGFSFTGNKWLVSLRSEGNFDVSLLAKQRGGGWHKNASGFEVLNFEDIFI
jgi:nanoRNase/pAp phosphatase (c-di-AMP/oligoRNAs hydrolase)